jgi:hypothetical protein
MKTKQLKKKELLSGQLLSYSVAAGALLAIGNQTDAQVTVTEVDSLLNPAADENEIYELDLNNDGTIDFNITAVATAFYNWGSIVPAPNAQLATSVVLATCSQIDYNIAVQFEEGDVIDANLNFFSSTASMGYWGIYGCTVGPWHLESEGDKFMGVRITLDGGASYNYGWVRLECDTSYANIRVVDYGFEATPDKEILAGATSSVSVEELLNAGSAHVYSADNRIIITDMKKDEAQAEIFNSLGQLIRSVPINSDRKEVLMETNGIYFVRLRVGNRILESSKVLVQ